MTYKKNKDKFFIEAKTQLTYAFQPIVNIHTGVAYGYEALLRGYDKMGFANPQEVFDSAWSFDILHSIDILLRETAIRRFSQCEAMCNSRLFFNIDGRCFESPDYQPEQTHKILNNIGLAKDALCLELSEAYDNSSASHIREILDRCRKQNFRLALDDYGRGYSELRMLYDYQPDYLKIDRFFIDNIAADQKKRMMVSNIVKMAHGLGISVVAEGIEKEQDFLACKDVGCNLVQGYLVARPAIDLHEIRSQYPIVNRINQSDKRNRKNHGSALQNLITAIPTIRDTNSAEDILDAFKNSQYNFLPIVDSNNEPRGIVREADMKNVIYSQFGHSLLRNKGLGSTFSRFVKKCPIVAINQSLDEILTVYAVSDIPEGIMVTKDFEYIGFLTSHSFLQLLNERRLEQAQHQNPLTGLPGNHLISSYIANALDDNSGNHWIFVYFDFNNFKPFNDRYGFRQGDRAILLFSDIIKRNLSSTETFIGHVGGDDFFAGFNGTHAGAVHSKINKSLDDFNRQVESFYEIEDRERGYLEEKNRSGKTTIYALLSCSAAILHLPPGYGPKDEEQLSGQLADMKKLAKKSEGFIAHAYYGEQQAKTLPTEDKKLA